MPVKRCAFLTMENTDGWAIDSDLCFAPLHDLGWSAEWLPWRSGGVAWDTYEAVYIAATWDYPQDPERFMRVLTEIDRSRAVLVNDISLVRWNLSKTYLRDLQSAGAEIVPSLWYEDFAGHVPDAAFDILHCGKIIIKPAISTNATDTFLLGREIAPETRRLLESTFHNRAFFVQPFMHRIQSEGEFSLFYFAGVFSHAILKTPKAQDFRVQEEHGANIFVVDPPRRLRETASRVLKLVEPEPVYARLDFVRGRNDVFLLMELELIEPSMYLRLHAQAPGRLAAALDRYVRTQPKRRPN